MSTAKRLGLVLLALLAATPRVAAEDPPLDVDRWHRMRPFLRPSEVGDPGWRWAFGVFPHASFAIGLPDGLAAAPAVNLSLARSGRWSVFAGYGLEVAPQADGELWTVGWGGVHGMEGSLPQQGFHGTYLRYRRWDTRDHGVHRGLSAGAASSVGPIGIGLEVGAARSERNHWLPVAQIQIILGLPHAWRW